MQQVIHEGIILSQTSVRGRGNYNNKGRGGRGNRGAKGGRNRNGGNMQQSDLVSYNSSNGSFTPTQIEKLLNLLPKATQRLIRNWVLHMLAW